MTKQLQQYDLCVIGGGPSGYAAAMRALDLGKKVLLVEKDKIGGAGLHNGALSSKTFWEIAQDITNARQQADRCGLEAPQFPFAELQREVREAVSLRQNMLERQLTCLCEAESSCKLDLAYGYANLESAHLVRITQPGRTWTVAAENIVLATGSKPRLLPDLPIDEQIILTSDGIDNLQDYPKSMVILGAGVIGCEFATIFSLLGHTKVYLIDKAERILPFEDPDVVKVVEKGLEAHGAVIHHNAQLVRMEVVDGEVEYELAYQDGRKEVLRVEKALVSIGRVPNTEGLGLEKAGVKLTKRGHILETGKDTSTSVANIYAVGDITADIALVNVGELEGRFAVEKIFGVAGRELCYDNISTIMFLHPEVAGVGMNEIQACAAGIPYRLAALDYSAIPRAVAMRQTEGFFKILVTDDDEMRVLGMRAIGRQASSAIQAVALLISMGKSIRELSDCVHPHPSIVEGVQECVRMLLGKSILKPASLTNTLRCGRQVDGKWSSY